MARHMLAKISVNGNIGISYQCSECFSQILVGKLTLSPLHLTYRSIFFMYSKSSKRLKSTDSESNAKTWKLKTNYFNDHHNKELFGPIRKKHTQDNKRLKWTKEEEIQVINQEILIREKNHTISEKEINEQLAIVFDNARTVGSYESRRKTSKWKTMFAQHVLDSKQSSVRTQKQFVAKQEDSKDTKSEIQESSEPFWLNRQREIALKKRNDSLQKLHDQMKPLHHAIAEASIQLSSHTIGNSKTTLKDISNAIKYEEPYDILEHGAKGNSLKN